MPSTQELVLVKCLFTIVAKVIYLLENKYAKANEILVLAYNNRWAKSTSQQGKNVNELRERFFKLIAELNSI